MKDEKLSGSPVRNPSSLSSLEFREFFEREVFLFDTGNQGPAFRRRIVKDMLHFSLAFNSKNAVIIYD